MEERRLPERARSVGAYFKERLGALADRHPEAVAEIRGRGLMLGMRLSSKDLALRLVYDLLARGLIVLPAGAGDVLEFVPPLTIATEQIDWAVTQMDAVLAVASR
jgi:4-aminobutyrate aminotransferase-like enzyme